MALGAAVEGLNAFELLERDLFIFGVPMASSFLDGDITSLPIYLFELPGVAFK